VTEEQRVGERVADRRLRNHACAAFSRSRCCR
jgi:hypothetical protein